MMRIMNSGCCKKGTAMEFIMDKKYGSFATEY
jgi:hypothetical protein